MKQIRECTYSAFISYANDDNTGWYRWVSTFAHELEQVLGGRARVKNVPPPFFGDETPVVAGRLSDRLQSVIASSFAMVIVVHENYAQSDWCLKELAYFREQFGDAGFLDRLYIVAMSETAMRVVEQKPTWQQLCPNGDQAWLQFFKADRRDDPVTIYQGMDDGNGVLSNEFFKPFNALVADLATKISRSANVAPSRAASVGGSVGGSVAGSTGGSSSAGLAASGRSASTLTMAGAAPAGNGSVNGVPTAIAPGVATDAGVVVASVATPGGVLLGVTTPELADAVAGLRASLLAAGLRADALGREALLGDFTEFDAAERLVLPFSNAQPLQPYAPGGHLAVQRDAWLARGKPAQSLCWLDMRQVAALQPAREPHTAFIAALATQAVELPALLARLTGEAPAGREGDGLTEDDDASESDAVRIYIESNRNERLLWKPLGEQIKKKWDKLIAGKRIAPPLFVRPRGLPIDEIERQFPLDDADGVVLFWGKKEPRSLLSQINKVEDRLRGRDLAPCIVAYLMPPQPDPKTPIVSWAWDVLRFEAASAEQIDVVADDTSELDGFLQRILERAGKKRSAAALSNQPRGD